MWFSKVYLVLFVFILISTYQSILKGIHSYLYDCPNLKILSTRFSQTWIVLANDLSSLNFVESLHTRDAKWKITKTPFCTSVHLKVCSWNQSFVWSLGRILNPVARWQCSFTKKMIILESAGPCLKRKEKHCLFISNFSPRLPGFSPQRGTNQHHLQLPGWNDQTKIISLPATVCCQMGQSSV